MDGIEIAVIGRTAVPVGRHDKWRWLFGEFDKLKDGQALRMVVPILPEFPRNSPASAWKRYCKVNRKKGHTRMVTNEKTRTHYFWFD